MKNSKQFTLAAMAAAIATLVGYSLYIPMFGGHVYLISIVLFSLPAILSWRYTLVTALISVTLTDILTGYGAYVWMTLIAYGSGMVALLMIKPINFSLATLAAASAIILGYFILDLPLFGREAALTYLVANILQFTVCVPLSHMVYYPLKRLNIKHPNRVI